MMNKKENAFIIVIVLLIVLLLQSLVIRAEDNKKTWISSRNFSGGWKRLSVSPSKEYVLGKGVYLRELVRGSNWDGSLDTFGLSVGFIPKKNTKLYSSMGFYYFNKSQIEYSNYGKTILYDIIGRYMYLSWNYILFESIVAPYIGAGINIMMVKGEREETETVFLSYYGSIPIKVGALIRITKNIKFELSYSPIAIGTGIKGPEFVINASLWLFPKASIPDTIEEPIEISIPPISEE